MPPEFRNLVARRSDGSCRDHQVPQPTETRIYAKPSGRAFEYEVYTGLCWHEDHYKTEGCMVTETYNDDLSFEEALRLAKIDLKRQCLAS